MKSIEICPLCGSPAIKVKGATVKNQLKSTKKADFDTKWHVCVQSGCECVYFNNKDVFTVADCKKPLFFKDRTDHAVVCYCYNTTVGDIRNAIEKGCKSAGEVRKHTKKHKTGSGCETNNPLGKSCSNVFTKTVNDLLKKK